MAPHPASELDREYGISDPQAAKLYGYHLPPRVTALVPHRAHRPGCKARLQPLPKWVAVESGYEQTLIARDRAVLVSIIQA